MMVRIQDSAVLSLLHPLQGVSLAVNAEERYSFSCGLTVDKGTCLLCLGVHDLWTCKYPCKSVFHSQASHTCAGDAVWQPHFPGGGIIDCLCLIRLWSASYLPHTATQKTGKEKSTPVEADYGRPWRDQGRPGPLKEFSLGGVGGGRGGRAATYTAHVAWQHSCNAAASVISTALRPKLAPLHRCAYCIRRLHYKEGVCETSKLPGGKWLCYRYNTDGPSMGDVDKPARVLPATKTLISWEVLCAAMACLSTAAKSGREVAICATCNKLGPSLSLCGGPC